MEGVWVSSSVQIGYFLLLSDGMLLDERTESDTPFNRGGLARSNSELFVHFIQPNQSQIVNDLSYYSFLFAK